MPGGSDGVRKRLKRAISKVEKLQYVKVTVKERLEGRETKNRRNDLGSVIMKE